MDYTTLNNDYMQTDENTKVINSVIVAVVAVGLTIGLLVTVYINLIQF